MDDLNESDKMKKHYLFTLIQVHQNPSWNEKQIRGFISTVLKNAFDVEPQPEKPKRTRKLKILEEA